MVQWAAGSYPLEEGPRHQIAELQLGAPGSRLLFLTHSEWDGDDGPGATRTIFFGMK